MRVNGNHLLTINGISWWFLCGMYIYIYIYIYIHSYEGDIMVLFGRVYNITVRYGSHGPFNLTKTMMYRLIECWISILWMCNRKIITNHPCLMKVSSPALITHIYLYREPAIITAPKINHWTMGATGVIIQVMIKYEKRVQFSQSTQGDVVSEGRCPISYFVP